MKSFNVFFRAVTTSVLIISLLIPSTVLAAQQQDQSKSSKQDFYSRNDIEFIGEDCKTEEQPKKELTIEQKIGQMLYLGFEKGEESTMGEVIKKGNVGAVYVKSKEAVKAATEQNSGLTAELIISSDDEGGEITRLLEGQPSARDMGGQSVAQVQGHGKNTGTELKKLGANAVLAPVMDVDVNLKNAIHPYGRAFSNDAAVVEQKAIAWATGVTEAKAGVTFKHFPGIGHNTGNTDLTHVQMDRPLNDFAGEIKPYRNEFLNKTKSAAVMLANFALKEWGDELVGLNPKAVEYLRNDVKFSGLIVTDDLIAPTKDGYGDKKLTLEDAVARAADAGVDMPLFTFPKGADITKIVNAVKDKVDRAKIDKAYENVVAYKTALGLKINDPNGGGGGPANKNVYIIGDSISVMGTKPFEKAFQAVGFKATVDAVGGRNVANAIKEGENTGLESVEANKDKIKQSGSVVIELGTNNLRNSNAGGDKATLDKMVNAVKAANPNAIIYWVDVGVIWANIPASYKNIHDDVNKIIYASASEHGYKVISWANTIDSSVKPPEGSVRDIKDSNGYFGGDGIHPNGKGLDALGKAMAQAVSTGGGGGASPGGEAPPGGETPPPSGDSSTPPESGGSSSPPSVQGGDNAEKIWRFLTSTPFKATNGKPFNAVQAAGALGNFYAESGYKFDIIQAGKGEVGPNSTASGVGYGIAQWDGERRKQLYAIAEKLGKKWSDPETQFEMIKIELNDEAYPGGGKSGEGTRLKNFQGGEFNTTNDPKRASYIFMASYERAGTPNQPKRDNAAMQAYEKYKNLAPGAPPASSDGCEGGGTSTGKSDGSKATFVTSDGFAVYMQTDPRWKGDPYSSSTIGKSGCGPSAMTMIITALTGKAMDIREVMKKAGDGGQYVPGSGSSWTVGPFLAKEYGLKSKKLPKNVEAANEALKAGSLILLSGQGAVPFSRGGHYIAIRGLTDDGKWKVGDSAHRKANEESYDPNFILSMARDNLVAISK